MAIIQKTIPNVGKNVEKLEPSYIADDNVIYMAILEKQFCSLLKIKQKLTNNSTPRNLLQEKWKPMSNKYLFTEALLIIAQNW